MSVVLAAVAALQTAAAQSVCRLMTAGGRQVELSGVSIKAFDPDDRHVLVIGDVLTPCASTWCDSMYWYDRFTGQYDYALTAYGGGQPNNSSVGALLSSTGRYLAIESLASNIVPGDTNNNIDVYVVDRQTGAVVRASLGTGGVEPNGMSGVGGISADGRYVAFTSSATNLSAHIGGYWQIYRRDTQTDVTELITLGYDGNPSDAGVSRSVMSADGRFVAYVSWASNLVIGDTNARPDLFLYDHQTQTTTMLDIGPGGAQANYGVGDLIDMTPDGRWIAFDSPATNLVAAASNGFEQVFVVDRLSGAIELVSADSAGQCGDDSSIRAHLTPDGRYVAFTSAATNLDPTDGDTRTDAFVCDRSTGEMRLISRSTAGAQGTATQGNWVDCNAISPSARLIGFETDLFGLVAGDTNLWWDAFIYDAQSTCPAIESYCTPKINALGCEPRISSGGEPYTSGGSDSFFISANGVRAQTAGALIWSFTQSATPFHGGTRCVGAPLVRTAVQDSGAFEGSSQTCQGTYSFHMSRAYMTARGIGPGTTVFAQYWSRDPDFAFPNNAGLTDGLRFTTSP